MEGGPGSGSWVFMAPCPVLILAGGHPIPGADPLGARQPPELTGASLGAGTGLSWVSATWGVGRARSP